MKNKLEITIPRFLNEWKNVSDDVIELVNYISDAIIKDASKQRWKISHVNYRTVLTNENNLTVKISQNNVDQTIKIKYYLYNVSSEEEYNWLIDTVKPNLNCTWDEDVKTLTIVSVLVNEKPNNNFRQSITHEIEHMYQYFQGMQKRVSLYDECVKLIENSNDKIPYFIGLGCYFTFKHEQDAYIQQFYQHLEKYNYKINFDAALSKYRPFLNIKNVYKALDDYYDNPKTIKYINQIGYSRQNYYKRLYYAYNRLIKKLENVYERWVYDNKSKFLTKEGLFHRAITELELMIKLNEGKDVILWQKDNFIIEDFYNIK